MTQITGMQDSTGFSLLPILKRNNKNVTNYLSYINRTAFDEFDHSFNYPVEDKTLPIDSFVLLINRDPLTYHNFTYVDQELQSLKDKPDFALETFSLDDFLTLLHAEEKDWENEAATFMAMRPSWNIRKALAERALEYFNADTRAEIADIILRSRNNEIQCEIVRHETENSYRLYRNSLDLYNNHIHAYEYALENTKSVGKVINIYMNQLQKIQDGHNLEDDQEEFEWNQEAILIKISDYIEHWREIRRDAVDHKNDNEKVNAEENIVLFTSLFDRTCLQFIPIRNPIKKRTSQKRSKSKNIRSVRFKSRQI